MYFSDMDPIDILNTIPVGSVKWLLQPGVTDTPSYESYESYESLSLRHRFGAPVVMYNRHAIV